METFIGILLLLCQVYALGFVIYWIVRHAVRDEIKRLLTKENWHMNYIDHANNDAKRSFSFGDQVNKK